MLEGVYLTDIKQIKPYGCLSGQGRAQDDEGDTASLPVKRS